VLRPRLVRVCQDYQRQSRGFHSVVLPAQYIQLFDCYLRQSHGKYLHDIYMCFRLYIKISDLCP
jgi:hypothetical protein